MNRFVSTFISFGALFQCCCNSSMTEPIFLDPYMDSFRGKNLKWMVGYDPRDSSLIDTTFFNAGGDMTRKKGFMSDIRMEFDENHFITRRMQSGENGSNFLIENSIDPKGIVRQQWWTLNNHLRWDYDNAERDSLFRVVKFEFNRRGLLVKSIDSTANAIVVYKYDENRLSGKEEFDLTTGVKEQTWYFLYDDQNEIKEIGVSLPEFKISTQYFSKGLLDSMVDTRGTIRYRYSYK